jgi:phosphoribosylanthranilate isomerase
MSAQTTLDRAHERPSWGAVAAAIEQVRPFGVDVSSGVEERPGVKSPEKIASFVEAARSRSQAAPLRGKENLS